ALIPGILRVRGRVKRDTPSSRGWLEPGLAANVRVRLTPTHAARALLWIRSGGVEPVERAVADVHDVHLAVVVFGERDDALTQARDELAVIARTVVPVP